MDTTFSVKGQIVIPSKVRKRLGIRAGSRVQIDVDADEQRIILTPFTRETIKRLRGRYKGKGLLKALMAEKKREKDR